MLMVLRFGSLRSVGGGGLTRLRRGRKTVEHHVELVGSFLFEEGYPLDLWKSGERKGGGGRVRKEEEREKRTSGWADLHLGSFPSQNDGCFGELSTFLLERFPLTS